MHAATSLHIAAAAWRLGKQWVRCNRGWCFPSVAAVMVPTSPQADGIACQKLGQAGSGWLCYDTNHLVMECVHYLVVAVSVRVPCCTTYVISGLCCVGARFWIMVVCSTLLNNASPASGSCFCMAAGQAWGHVQVCGCVCVCSFQVFAKMPARND